MSAAEIIEMIKKLPPEEQAEVFAFARAVEVAGDEPRVRYASDAEVKKVSAKIFADHRDLFRKLAQ